MPQQPSNITLQLVSLHDDEIALCPILPDDMGPLFTWLNDTEAAALDRVYRPLDFDSFKNWLDDMTRNGALFAIRKLDHLRIIGFVSLTNISPVHRCAELTIRIGAQSDRGKGYGKRAIKLALKHAWQNLNLHRVQLSVLATNLRALRAYEASGFQREGILRDGAYVAGKREDLVVMGTLVPPRLCENAIENGSGTYPRHSTR